MIKNELFANDGTYTPYYTPTLKTSKKLSELNLTTIPHQYANGCIHTDNIAHFNKLTKVTQNGNTFTLTKNCESGYVDVMSLCFPWTTQSLVNAPNVIGKNSSGFYNAMFYDGFNYPSVLYDYRFVNDVNANHVTIQINPVLVLFGYGQPTIGYNRFGLYGYIRGYDNIINFLNGETVAVRMGRHNSDTGNYTRFINVNISDFESGVHEYSGNDYKIWVWLAGINLNATFLGDTWQTKDWSYQYYTSNVLNTYCLKIKDSENEYLINELSRDYPDYNADYFGDVMPYGFNLLNHYCDLATDCIFTDLECEVDNSISETTTNLHQHGDTWIFFNNNNLPRIYYCCNKNEIFNQLAGVFRAWVDGATIDYYSNDAKLINYTVNQHCIYNVIADNVYQGYVVRGTSDNINLLSDFQKTNTITNSTYDYTKDKPKEDKDFGDLVSKIGFSSMSTTTGTMYTIAPTEINSIINRICSTYSTDTILDISDGFISCIYYPIDIYSANLVDKIKIGAYNDNGTIKPFEILSTTAKQLINTVVICDLGTLQINPFYNDFRDFEPYSTYSLFIPYINTTYNIDFKTFKNHTLSVKLIIDVLTGSCVACILRDKLLYDTTNGNVGVSIQITSADTATYNASVRDLTIAKQQNEINEKMAVVNFANNLTSAITGGNVTSGISAVTDFTSNIINSEINRQKIDYALQTSQIHHSTTQTASSNCGTQLEKNLRLIIAHPKMLDTYDADIYAKTVGYACCKNCAFSDCSNYTVISNIDLSGINATETEKTLLKNILANGIVI